MCTALSREATPREGQLGGNGYVGAARAPLRARASARCRRNRAFRAFLRACLRACRATARADGASEGAWGASTLGADATDGVGTVVGGKVGGSANSTAVLAPSGVSSSVPLSSSLSSAICCNARNPPSKPSSELHCESADEPSLSLSVAPSPSSSALVVHPSKANGLAVGVSGDTSSCTTRPTPLVRPSRKKIPVSSVTYSAAYANRNRTRQL